MINAHMLDPDALEVRAGRLFEPTRRLRKSRRTDALDAEKLRASQKKGFGHEKKFRRIVAELIQQKLLSSRILSVHKPSRIEDTRRKIDAKIKVDLPFVGEHFIKVQIKSSIMGMEHFKAKNPEALDEIYIMVVDDDTTHDHVLKFVRRMVNWEERRLRQSRRQ